MFGPEWKAGCSSCSAIADAFDGSAVHLANHDVMLWAVSRAPLAKLQAYRKRMGWSFPWASSFGSDFNHDFGVSHTDAEMRAGTVEYNFRSAKWPPPPVPRYAAEVGTDWETAMHERPGLSAFALQDGAVHHTYSTYSRGLDGLWGMYQWLDRAPLGRNEDEPGQWWRRADEYGNGTPVPGAGGLP
jgi:predicted dithiol-disulfide oxidoreductase (DUF899 family)